jgi:uncharacterized SAM-binding protein YcdF (DUF218 family)
MRQESQWQRHFFYRKESLKTTWKFRLALLILLVFLVSVTRGFWMSRIGQSLVCTEKIAPGAVLLVENFNPHYHVFARAAALHKAGLAARVLVPVDAARDSARADPVSQGITEVMARIAQLQQPVFLPIQISEPISLNTAYQVRDFLTTEHLRSVIIVTDGFRSKRSSLVYRAVLEPAGIEVGCVPVFGQKTLQNWAKTWHGIEDVTEQFVKLQYYRFHVLWRHSS